MATGYIDIRASKSESTCEMIVEDRIDAIRKWTLDQRRHGASIGLVPTMGALHEGHISLVRASRSQCQKTVATIFVNPAQFAAGEDLDRYPRTLDADLEKLDAAGVDAVFTPTSVSMYPKGFSTYVDTPRVARTLEGLDRPTHFRGVTTVVLKLFNIIPATHAFFGQKDYQQAAVIRAMVRDLDVGIDIEVCPIVPEADGLAMSSRNRYLSPEQRQRALSLSQALVRAKELFAGGCRDASHLEDVMHDLLDGVVDSIDYIVIADRETLGPIYEIAHSAVALIAARVGETRLIDNEILAES